MRLHFRIQFHHLIQPLIFFAGDMIIAHRCLIRTRFLFRYCQGLEVLVLFHVWRITISECVFLAGLNMRIEWRRVDTEFLLHVVKDLELLLDNFGALVVGKHKLIAFYRLLFLEVFGRTRRTHQFIYYNILIRTIMKGPKNFASVIHLLINILI